ncbi:MAG: hypothetical protein CVU85_00270 [Firmicutes bacterium HGW-Firmicutes-10]|nr:MAG: hypothetical protein CVU85_00270 [Firmicutes bacterium HGW-Firmicutes-10]
MKKRLYLVIVLFLVLGCSPKPIEEKPDPEDPIVIEDPVVIEEPIVRSVFNGFEYDEDEYEAFSIMIENTAAARPQSGLSLADIVYEIAVDGWNISRFMAIFGTNHPNKVGPVRSARVPFANLQKEWKLPFAHYGSAETGQGDALVILKSINLPIRFDGHKGLNDEFYSRDSARSSPHNAYFNAEKAMVKIPELTYEKRFTFDDISNVDNANVETVTMKYSTINLVKYEYDSTTKKYLRFVNGDPHMDAYTKKQLAITNIIVLHAPHRSVEAAQYVLVDFIGEGKAEYFVNGKHEIGSWLKSSGEAITKFFNSAGEEIVLLPGNTWIQVVHDKIKIEVLPVAQ